jgi:hypothetical protein
MLSRGGKKEKEEKKGREEREEKKREREDRREEHCSPQGSMKCKDMSRLTVDMQILYFKKC